MDNDFSIEVMGNVPVAILFKRNLDLLLEMWIEEQKVVNLLQKEPSVAVL